MSTADNSIAPAINFALSPQEAGVVMEALNTTLKASPNALAAGGVLIPLAAKLEQAVQVFNAAMQAAQAA